ncbi:GNAT family N-acetyltransferase [Sphingomonas sp. LT1P40]|uniref:GNAT family N-acetyltransferase n=1 Tax=Alteristakelama amylovorans TaxID=3096166 RepID=UPI002FCA807B
MSKGDLAAVTAISAAVHGRYAEPLAVYAERLVLYPAGCFVWDDVGEVHGLLVSHPWHRDTPPALGALLGAIPANADTFYLHDIALLPETRGQGAGSAATALVTELAVGAGLAEITLVAVNCADRFWTTQGFEHDTDAASVGYGPGTFLMHRDIDQLTRRAPSAKPPHK